MTLELLIAFNLVLFAALASPGPAMLYSIRTSVVHGRRAGVLAGLGLALMASLWTLAAFCGLEAIFILFPWAYGTLKIGGAAYLIWIAIGMWRDASKPLAGAAPTGGPGFWQGLLINLANPKSALFAGAVIVVLFPSDLTWSEIGLVVGNQLVVEMGVYAGFALALANRHAQEVYKRLKPILDRIFAGVLGLLGLRLLIVERT